METTTQFNVLLIDDDEDEYIILRDLMRQMSAVRRLEWASTYEDGVRRALLFEHDVYLVDYYLGKETGVALLRLLRERGCRAPVLILTGRDGDGIDQEALEAGATDYLEKGNLSASLLERAIRYAVRQQLNQNRLEDLVQQVSHLEQLKTDMIRVAAHDLRSPLTVMSGYIGMLRTDLAPHLNEQQVGYFEQIKTSVERMQHMVTDILSLERIAELSGGHTDPVNLSALVRKAYERYAAQATQQFTLDLQNSEDVIVYGVYPLLVEAVDNLISNALKYTPKDGRINVALSADADSALFTVTDSGYGIPKEMQQNLFKPFFRAKTKETRGIEGTGLGLNLVKSIIERHNGQIHFESNYGKGSTFGFILPAATPDD